MDGKVDFTLGNLEEYEKFMEMFIPAAYSMSSETKELIMKELEKPIHKSLYGKFAGLPILIDESVEKGHIQPLSFKEYDKIIDSVTPQPLKPFELSDLKRDFDE